MGTDGGNAVITLVPVLILVWALQKNFVQGLAMGAVKGQGKEHRKKNIMLGDSIHGGGKRGDKRTFSDDVRWTGRLSERLVVCYSNRGTQWENHRI